MSKYRPDLAFRLAGLKAIIVVAIAIAWWIAGGDKAAYSVMLGGVAIILPNFLFAYRMLVKAEKVTGAEDARQLGAAFFAGEVVKLFFIAALTALFILTVPMVLLPFMCGFIGALFGFWLAPVVLKT